MKVAFIGLGIMGMPMATNVAKKYDLIGYDIVKKETPFPFASSYEECLHDRDVIISMVPNNQASISLYQNLLPYLHEGQICIDMSTIAPDANHKILEMLEPVGVSLLDCPVVKSQPAAVKGELGIYVGGEEVIFEKVKDILLCMGKNIIHIGGHGAGLTMKILHNALVGEIQNGVNEILGMAEKLGLNLNKVVTAFSYGGAQNFYMDGKAKNIIANEFPTAFSVANMNKDVHFAGEIADKEGIAAPSLHRVINVYEKAMEKGLEKEDFSATYKIVNDKE